MPMLDDGWTQTDGDDAVEVIALLPTCHRPTDRRSGSEKRANYRGFLTCRKALGVLRTAGPFFCAAPPDYDVANPHTRASMKPD